MRRLACLTSAVLVACTTATDLDPIATITLQPALDSVEVGQVWNNWVVTLKDANNELLTGRALAWESNNPGIASVNSSTGEITGVAGGGDALITVQAEGKQAQAVIRVLYPIVSIIATPDSFDLPLTTSRSVVPQLVGPNGIALTNRSISYSSSNPGIAVVGSTGVVTAVSLGTTTITIRAGLKEANVRVRVVGEPVQSVRILPAGSVQVVRLGQTRQLSAQCLSASQQVLTGRTITWNSTNPLAASVNGTGLVTGNAVGTANISATCDNSVTGTITMQVTLVPVSTVTISPSELTIPRNTQSQLQAIARDSAGNTLSLQGRQVLWSSNNIPVAQVSTAGVVFGANIGVAQVGVSVDGVESAPITVNVTAFYSLQSLQDGKNTPAWARPVNGPR